MSSLFKLFAVVFMITALAASPSLLQSAERPPNIVLLVADDLGYGETGCQGNEQIPTPHIDSLAQGGVRCAAAYVTASFCSASRAGLMTGRYQTRFGHEFNPTGRHNLAPNAGLPLEEITLADHLRKAGYATGLVGKWHLGGADKFHPLQRGFDEFFGFLHEGHYFKPAPYAGLLTFLRRKTLPNGMTGRLRDGDTIYSTHLGYNEPPYDENNPILRGKSESPEDAYFTDALAREAVAFIERHKRRPFLLDLSFSAVHSPMQAKKSDLTRFPHISDVHRRIFAGMLASMDDAVGEVLKKLRQEGLEDRTLIFFLSDNGGPTRELTSSNAPLRGGKGTMYEGGIRVPFIAQWKGTLPEGEVYHHPVLSTDLFNTCATAAGLATPTDRKMDGVDLTPYLSKREKGAPHETLFWRMGAKAALRHGDWKIVRHPAGGREASFELYDLASDLSETKNLAGSHAQKLDELTSLWSRVNKEMVEPVWSPGRARK